MTSDEWARLEKVAKIMKRVIIKDNGCWIFPSNANRGQLRNTNGEVVYVHRYFYELWTGNLLGDSCVRHLCFSNGRCINPDHLLPGTNKENVQDKIYPPAMDMIARLKELGYTVSG